MFHPQEKLPAFIPEKSQKVPPGIPFVASCIRKATEKEGPPKKTGCGDNPLGIKKEQLTGWNFSAVNVFGRFGFFYKLYSKVLK